MLRTARTADKPDDQTSLDLASIMMIRGRAFGEVRRRADEITRIADCVEGLDAAIQQMMADRSVDDQQAVVSATRRLVGLIEQSQPGRAT